MLPEFVSAEERTDYEGRLAIYEGGCKQPIQSNAADEGD